MWGCAVCHNISIHTDLILPFMIYGLIFAQQIIAHTHTLYVIKRTMIVIQKTSSLCSTPKMT